jgi:hypothetical protein
VQVGEERKFRAKVIVLARNGLLDLDHHLGVGPDVIRLADDLRSNGLVFVIGKAGERTGVVLDKDLMACIDKRSHTRRGDADTRLMVFDFLGNTDNHRFLSHILSKVNCNGEHRR